MSFIACRTCSPCIARISRSHSASQCLREKCKKGRETGVFYFSWGKSCEQEKKQRGGVVSLQCRRFLRARKCFCSWKLHDGGYNNTNKTRTRFRPPIGVFPALLLRAALHYPNAWNGLCQHGPRGLGLLKSYYALGLLGDMISFLCPGEWVLRISSDRDARRIFWGLKFSISGFFGWENFGRYFPVWVAW